MNLSIALTALLVSPTAGGCTGAATAAAVHAAPGDVVETALAAGSFKTLTSALGAADLADVLRGEGPFTVFAPTDEAFAKLPAEKLSALLEPENQALLRSILSYHVVPGRMLAADVAKSDGAATVAGQRLAFEADDDGVTVGGASVVRADIECSNGVIHAIDSVLMPSTSDIVATAIDAGSFQTLVSALRAAGLVQALQGEGPFTVFAPTDDAFASLPEGTLESLLKPESKERLVAILKHHVVPGRVYAGSVAPGGDVETLQGTSVRTGTRGTSVYVGNARVVQADIEASNGVIHVIDSVLLPE